MRIALGCAEGSEAGALPPHPHPLFEKAGENSLVAFGTTEGFLPASRPSGAARLVSFMGSVCGGPQPLNTMGRRTAPGPAGGAVAFCRQGAGGPVAGQTQAPGAAGPPGLCGRVAPPPPKPPPGGPTPPGGFGGAAPPRRPPAGPGAFCRRWREPPRRIRADGRGKGPGP